MLLLALMDKSKEPNTKGEENYDLLNNKDFMDKISKMKWNYWLFIFI